MKNSTEESKKEFQIFDRIKRIRLLKGMSLREISQKAGLSENYLSQVENGKANPSIGTIKKITDALALPLIALLIGEENNKRSISQKSNRVKIVKANERKTTISRKWLRRKSACKKILLKSFTGENKPPIINPAKKINNTDARL